MKLWQNRYAQAFAIAGYVGSVSALGVYFTSLTQGLTWQQQVSIIGTSFIMPFAALAKALPDPLHQSSQVRAENVEQMTVNPAPAPADPPAAATEPPAVNVTARARNLPPPRVPKGEPPKRPPA